MLFCKEYCGIGSEFPTALLEIITVSWTIIQCLELLIVWRSFLLESKKSFHYTDSEDGGKSLLRNFGNCLLIDKALYTRRLKLQLLQILKRWQVMYNTNATNSFDWCADAV